MGVIFYTVNSCATCGNNGLKLAEAKQLGLDYRFQPASGMNADILSATRDFGLNLVEGFFTDGKNFAKNAEEFLANRAKPVKMTAKKTTTTSESEEEVNVVKKEAKK